MAFLIINFPTAFFQAPDLMLQLIIMEIKKSSKKVVFTGRLLGGVCTLYSIAESIQYIHNSLLCVFDNAVTNNTPRRAAAYRLIA